MRLGLFGGSFDPVHYGHLLLAESCREQCHLDQVLFVPAGVPPHKRDHAQAPPDARVEMLELAVGGHPAFAVSRLEIERSGVSYTVDTLRHYRAADPQSELFFLLGADMLHDLPHWREAATVCQLAVIVAVRRAGVPEPDFGSLREITSTERIELFRQHQVEMPEIGLSSSEIRHRVAAGQSIRYWTPRAVEKYMETQGLYRGE
jgi:nicotinate-nucleotide adenylyltransferase